MNETPAAVPLNGATPAIAAPFPLPPADPDHDVGATLPADHPRWQRDVVSISSRARAVIARLAPIVVRALTFWDHRIREIAFGRRTLSVDPAGSYRLR